MFSAINARVPGGAWPQRVPGAGSPADIVAIATSISPWGPAVHVATALAARWGSLLTGCFVDDALRGSTGPDCVSPAYGLLQDTRALDAGKGTDFRAFTQAKGALHASWIIARAGLSRVLHELDGRHSLAVLERDLIDREAATGVIGDVLLTWRLPSLILPPQWDGGARFTRVLVAWDGTAGAARAIRAALPFLQDAGRVVLFDGERTFGREAESCLPRFEPFVYLARHGVEADLVCAESTTGIAVMDRAQRMDADLIVISTFGLSHWCGHVPDREPHRVSTQTHTPLFIQH
jgi:hypothetical protein